MIGSTVAAPPRARAPRRPLATRDASWPNALAGRLARAGVKPNDVSIASLAAALATCAAFWWVPGAAVVSRALLLLVAAATIQLRLLCNLLDGLLAVEEGLESKTGELYNELPDRISDVLALVGAGFAIRHLAYGTMLGWLAATLAVLTAYVRVLGRSIGATPQFVGPMAKQHRMFTLTVGSLLSAAETLLGLPNYSMPAALAAITAGSIATIVRRVSRIAREVGGR